MTLSEGARTSVKTATLTEVAQGTWCWAVMAMHTGRRVRLKNWPDPHQCIFYDAIDHTYRHENRNLYHVPTTLFDGWELYEPYAPIVVEPGSFMWAVALAHLAPVAIRSGDSLEFKMDGGVLKPCEPHLGLPHEVMHLSQVIDKRWKVSTHTPPTPPDEGGITL